MSDTTLRTLLIMFPHILQVSGTSFANTETDLYNLSEVSFRVLLDLNSNDRMVLGYGMVDVVSLNSSKPVFEGKKNLRALYPFLLFNKSHHTLSIRIPSDSLEEVYI